MENFYDFFIFIELNWLLICLEHEKFGILMKKVLSIRLVWEEIAPKWNKMGLKWRLYYLLMDQECNEDKRV